jgi:hypothetical protein
MSDRSASLGRCFTTASGRQSFPQVGQIPRISRKTHHARSHPIVLARAAGQTSRLSQAVDEVTGSKTHSDQHETNNHLSAHAVN